MLFVDRPLGRLTIIEQYWKLAMARKGKNKSSTVRAREEKSDCVGLFVLVPPVVGAREVGLAAREGQHM